MRVYIKRFGEYAGEYLIFDTINEAIEELSGDYAHLNTNKQDLTLPKLEVFPIWFTGTKGDWVRTDDGRVTQLYEVNYLYKYLRNGSKKKFRNGLDYYTAYFKVCFGIYSYYTLKSGEYKIYRTMNADLILLKDYAVDTGALYQSFEHRPFGKYLTNGKKLFCYWLSRNGCDPEDAYIRAHKNEIHHKNKKYILEKALTLMQDQYVIEELKWYMSKDKTFLERMKESFKTHNLTPERFAEELDNGLKACTTPETIEKVNTKTGELTTVERPNKKMGGLGHLAWVRTLGQAVASVENPTEPKGLLSEDTGAERYVAPSAPEEVMQKVEASFTSGNGKSK